jgi:antitoxin HicB
MFMYPVTLTADRKDGGFVVTFTDIPEAITQGDTKEEALAAAKDALESALDFYFEDKRTVPAPSKPKRGQHVIELPASLSAKVLLLNRNDRPKRAPRRTRPPPPHHTARGQPFDQRAAYHED